MTNPNSNDWTGKREFLGKELEGQEWTKSPKTLRSSCEESHQNLGLGHTPGLACEGSFANVIAGSGRILRAELYYVIGYMLFPLNEFRLITH